jgi:hypothetical protein
MMRPVGIHNGIPVVNFSIPHLLQRKAPDFGALFIPVIVKRIGPVDPELKMVGRIAVGGRQKGRHRYDKKSPECRH